ncbi:hypothetical protein HDU79_001914, partial [Rhizoclosmatium sp. JEL0117]
MGKASKGKKEVLRHNPLHVDIINDSPYSHSLAASTALDKADPLLNKQKKQAKPAATATATAAAAAAPKKADLDDDDESESRMVDAKTSQKIMDLARAQQNEETVELQRPKKSAAAAQKAQFRFSAAKKADSDDEEEETGLGDDFDADAAYEANLDIDEEDAALIEKFMAKEPRKQLNLADLIMEKLSEAATAPKPIDPAKEKEIQDNMYKDSSNLDPKIIEVYSKVGVIMSRYRSGKLPKAFKLIPSLPNWEQVLYLTNPSGWTPHATYQATRIFVSNLQARMAQRFFNLFLLDRVRDDIAETKKLNYHLYLALKKSLYKPAAFFKGLLLPLCESGQCTLREAAIIGSVVTKVSIPILDSAAAILKIAEMEYS